MYRFLKSLIPFVVAFIFVISILFSSKIAKAAIPNGSATVTLSPESGTFSVGEVFDVTESFNTSGVPVSGIAIRLLYPYSGIIPEVRVDRIQISPSLSTADWNCPTQTFRTEGSNVVIDVACANTSAAGYTSSLDTTLATITFKVDHQPLISPVIIRFDPANSVITRKSDNQDILAIPTSNVTLNFPDSSYTPTPTPTIYLTPTPTFFPTPTVPLNSNASLTFSSNEKGVVKGSEVKVDAYLDTNTEVSGVDVFIDFDKTVLKYLRVEDQLPGVGNPNYWQGKIVLIQRYKNPIIGRVKLGTVVFEALNSGSSEIEFVKEGVYYDSKVFAKGGSDILTKVNKAQIKVNNSVNLRYVIKVLIRKIFAVD